MSSGKLIDNSNSNPSQSDDSNSNSERNLSQNKDEQKQQHPSTQNQLIEQPTIQRSSIRRKSEVNNNSSSKITGSSNTVKKKRPKWKKQLSAFLDSTPVLIITSLFTLFALFASDIKAAWLRIEVDTAFNVIQCMLLGFFGIEFILNCIAKQEYFLSFFFWLDLISTVSIIQN